MTLASLFSILASTGDWRDPVWDMILGVTLGLVCALLGLLVGAWIAFELLGRKSDVRRRIKRAVLAGGLPLAVIAFVIGYRIGVKLVYPV